MKLFIHIGTWKTGSSTIQYNLYKLKPELEKEGFCYLCKNNKMVINDGVIRNFTQPEDAYIRQSREKFKNILENRHKKKEDLTFLSSAEEFSGNPFRGFKNAGAVAENLYEITKNLGLKIKIIVYLRRQDDFFESLYQQSIRLGDSHSFSDFLEGFDSSDFNWYDLLRSYARFFKKENILVRRYHRKYLPGKNSLLHDFGRVIGSNTLSNYELTTSRNNGFSRDTLEITRIMNKHFDGDERFQLRKIYDQVNAKLPFEKYSFFSADERAAFLNQYRESNSAVVHEFLQEEEGQSLFPEPDFTQTREPYSGLSTESVVAHFSKALLLVKKNAEKENKNLEKKLKNKFFRFRARKAIVSGLNRYPKVKKTLKNLF